MRKIDIDFKLIENHRLIKLLKCSDHFSIFYDWAEITFRKTLPKKSKQSLDEILLSANEEELILCIFACFNATGAPAIVSPHGDIYNHSKSCISFFSWLARDSAFQRLLPVVRRIAKEKDLKTADVFPFVFAKLIFHYRSDLQNFTKDAIREVAIDRLEGSYRAKSGNDVEVKVAACLLKIVSDMHFRCSISDGPVKIGHHTFDRELIIFGKKEIKILCQIKSRETEGGGHAHLYDRDVSSAREVLTAGNIKMSKKVKTGFVVIAISENPQNITDTDDTIGLIERCNPNNFINFNVTNMCSFESFVKLLTTV